MKISRSYLFILLAVVTSVKSEKCSTSLNGKLVLAAEKTIWSVNPQDNDLEAYISAESPLRFSYSYTRNTIYYSDAETQSVYALKDNTTKAQVIIAAEQNKEWLPSGVAIDDVNDKLYFVEYSAGSLYVYDLKSEDRTVLISTLNKPKDLEIDADERYLFILDKNQILRTELDGSNPTSISDKNEVTTIDIDDMSLDVKSKRIYWLDKSKRTVESSDYNGEDKKIHLEDMIIKDDYRAGFVSLAFLNGAIYWANMNMNKVFKIDDGKSEIIFNKVNTTAIGSVDCEKQARSDNPCAHSECQEFCLLSKSSRTGYSCACKVGFELADDGKTCSFIQDFILYTKGAYVRGQSLSVDRKDVIEPARFTTDYSSPIDFDANSRIIYSVDRKRIQEIRLNGTQMKVLVPDLLSNRVFKHLAYDWTTNNLYYFTSYYDDAYTFNVMNTKNPAYSKILIMNVTRWHKGLQVHPNKGYVFFARLDGNWEEPKRGSISRLATDGSGLKVIIDIPNVNSLDALSVDLDEDRIYWTETTMSGEIVTRHGNLDGEDIHKLELPTKFSPTSLVIYNNYIYGVSNRDSLFRVDKNGKNPVNLGNGSLKDIKVFSHSLQITRPDHPCKSHKCQKFCFAIPTGTNNLKATCGCPYGEKLADDGFSCVDNSKAEPAFVPCIRSWSSDCYMQTL